MGERKKSWPPSSSSLCAEPNPFPAPVCRNGDRHPLYACVPSLTETRLLRARRDASPESRQSIPVHALPSLSRQRRHSLFHNNELFAVSLPLNCGRWLQRPGRTSGSNSLLRISGARLLALSRLIGRRRRDARLLRLAVHARKGRLAVLMLELGRLRNL